MDDKQIRDALRVEPPEVTEQEWDSVWDGIASSVPTINRSSRNRWKLAVAATFLIGLGIGFWGARVTAPVNLPTTQETMTVQEIPVEATPQPMVKPDRGQGLLGLYDIKITESGIKADGQKKYRITALTKNNIKVNMEY